MPEGTSRPTKPSARPACAPTRRRACRGSRRPCRSAGSGRNRGRNRACLRVVAGGEVRGVQFRVGRGHRGDAFLAVAGADGPGGGRVGQRKELAVLHLDPLPGRVADDAREPARAPPKTLGNALRQSSACGSTAGSETRLLPQTMCRDRSASVWPRRADRIQRASCVISTASRERSTP